MFTMYLISTETIKQFIQKILVLFMTQINLFTAIRCEESMNVNYFGQAVAGANVFIKPQLMDNQY